VISLTRPTTEQLVGLARSLEARSLSYTPGLLERADDVSNTPISFGGLADGWFVDRFADIVGHGPDDFAAAVAALRGWAMFDPAWTVMLEPYAAIEPGVTVTYAAQVLGVWWAYGCRILEVVDEPSRFGFVYGTIDGHAERGEELFQVRLLDDGDVEFSLVALSRPGRWFTWPGIPFARHAQRAFRPAAAAGVRRVVDERRREVGARSA
jgi:uncharacterized protein (UPF0548 family)